MATPSYPDALDAELVGTYSALAKAGGGFVWDAVLEYRVWCHPEHGAQDVDDGSDYYYAFATYEEASEFATQTLGSDEPLALVLQEEYIAEEEPGQYQHIKERRVTEWPVAFLHRPRRTAGTIPNFLAPDAPLQPCIAPLQPYIPPLQPCIAPLQPASLRCILALGLAPVAKSVTAMLMAIVQSFSVSHFVAHVSLLVLSLTSSVRCPGAELLELGSRWIFRSCEPTVPDHGKPVAGSRLKVEIAV